MPGFPAFAADPPSATVLAIDTTAATASVALLRKASTDRQCWTRVEPLTLGQSRTILSLVDSVLQDSGVSPQQIDVIGFGAGPGAFTGLRVACGVAQGLALGWACPVLGVDSLSTLAWQARNSLACLAPGARIVCALDVRMNEVALAVFDAQDIPTPDAPWADPVIETPEPILGPRLCSPEEAAQLCLTLAGQGFPMTYGGDGPKVYEALAFAAIAPAADQPQAEAVAELTLLGWRAGQAIDASEAAPFYLRDKVALDRQEQADLRAARELRREPKRSARAGR
jgi:tRNA threonylcarbamoyladenosine biosynthesis protein TsaB